MTEVLKEAEMPPVRLTFYSPPFILDKGGR